MAILHRKLLPGDIEPANNSFYTCTFTDDCEDSNVYPCLRCVYIYPPPPPVRQKSSENHLIPYLISAVCALGVAFLILTTCVVLLRCRFRRRRTPPARVASDVDTLFVDEDHGPVVDHPIWHIVTVGLQQSVIDSITSFKYKKSDGLIEGNDCSVCLTDFEDGDHLRLLPKCSHAFHLPCIDTWLRSHKNCPLCRAPVVNDSSPVNLTVLRPNSGEIGSSVDTQIPRSDNHGGSDNQAGQRRDRADDFDTLPVEGIRIAEILKRNRENRILSDLGENFRIMAEDFQPVRRSISLDSSAASAISNAVVHSAVIVIGEGSSKQQQKMIEVEKEGVKRVWRDSSMSGLMKSSSIGRSLQKTPVSMKRSISSSAKIFSSFRGGKSQSSSISRQ